ncbi:hypothetical protein [Sorangium sp. So ce1099]|uniref:hypothetical protein n=1 Tax=Sorangium sp. So ce1099 TaxID=3133331 RepID=UPI003F61A438
MLVTESRDTWCLHARSPELLVPWLQALGERRPRKPIWFPAYSAVLAESEPLEGEGLLFDDREPGVDGTFGVRNGSAVIRYRLPGGGMSLGLEKRATARLHARWISSWRLGGSNFSAFQAVSTRLSLYADSDPRGGRAGTARMIERSAQMPGAIGGAFHDIERLRPLL